MIQPLSEADHICQTLQVPFDKMICDVLEKYHSFPGFALFLGSIFLYVSAKPSYTLSAGIIVSSYLLWRGGEEHILEDVGLFGSETIFHSIQAVPLALGGISDFFSYLTGLLDSPERSGTHIFDQRRYVTAAQECLQLHLCNHRDFSKGATEFACRDKEIRRSKPWEWLARLGVHSRIRKGRHHFEVLRRQSIKAPSFHRWDDSFPESSPEHQYFRSLSYRWALVLLPFLLEKSPVSSELADVLRGCTFAMMAWKFPGRMRLAKEAIARYLLRVESAVGET